MVDSDEFARWREEADSALAVARAAAPGGFYNWACFAAEQSAQLAMKAILHGIGAGPWGQDLVRLAEKAKEAGLTVPTEVEDGLRRLGRHYIPARYPDAHASGSPGRHYGQADWLQAERDASAAISFVDETWARLS
jgi:HEPN domain-containing protein